MNRISYVQLWKMNVTDPEYVKAWGNNLRTIRRAKGLTALDLAVSIGVEDKQIRRIETGEISTSLTMIRALARALNIHPAELFKFDI